MKYKTLFDRNVIDTSLFLKRKLWKYTFDRSNRILGAHVLDALMKEGCGTIYCLVRGDSVERAEKDYLEFYNIILGIAMMQNMETVSFP